MRLPIGLVAIACALAGCGHSPAPADPVSPKKPDAAPVMAAKAAEPPKVTPPSAPAPIHKSPIVVDLTKVKWGQEGENFGWDDGEMRLHYWSNGTGEFTVKVPADGEYEIVVAAASQPALNVHASFKVAADGKAVGAETTCTSEDAKDYTFPATLSAGDRRISVAFTNDIYKENEYDRNFFLNGLKLVRVK